MPEYLVELYLPRTGSDHLREAAVRARSAAEATSRDGPSVRYVRSIFVPDYEMCFHLYEAGSQEEVRDASTRAGIPFQRIVEAVPLKGMSS